MDNWKGNPKMIGSGLIECIPQKGKCPRGCAECFFNNGSGYLEPLDDNTPHIPTLEMARGRVVRVNGGNDSNVERELVERTAQQYSDYFFNTSIPTDLGDFSGPVVLTVNPGKMTDTDFHELDEIPENLMYVRIRTNMWNWENVVKSAVDYYTSRGVPVVLTWMAYYETPIPDQYLWAYIYKKRTLNSYWCINPADQFMASHEFKNNPLIYQCGYKDTHGCAWCGNCLREYYATKERMRKDG